MFTPLHVGRDEFISWAQSQKASRARPKTLVLALSMGYRYETEHLSAFAQVAVAGLHALGSQSGIFADEGMSMVRALAERAPRRDGKPTINENRFIRLIRSSDWDEFYERMAEALLIINKVSPHNRDKAPVSAGGLFDMVALYDTADRKTFAYECMSEFANFQTAM